MKKIRFLTKALPLLCLFAALLSSCSTLKSMNNSTSDNKSYTLEGKMLRDFQSAEFYLNGTNELFSPIVLLRGSTDDKNILGVIYHVPSYTMAVKMRNRLMSMGMFQSVIITE